MVKKMAKILAGFVVIGLITVTTIALAHAYTAGEFQYNYGWLDESGCTEEYNNYQFMTYYACPDGCDYYPWASSLYGISCENLDEWLDYDYSSYAGFWAGQDCSDYALYNNDMLFYCVDTGCWTYYQDWGWECYDYFPGDFEYDFEINELCTEEYNSYIFQTYYDCPDSCNYYSRNGSDYTCSPMGYAASDLTYDYSGVSFWDEICNDYEAYTGTMQCFDNGDTCWYYVEDYTYWCNSGDTGTWSVDGGSDSDNSSTGDDDDSSNSGSYEEGYFADDYAYWYDPCVEYYDDYYGYYYYCPDACWYYSEYTVGYYYCEVSGSTYYYYGDSGDGTFYEGYYDYDEDWEDYWSYIYYDEYYYDLSTGCGYYYDGGSWCDDYPYGSFESNYSSSGSCDAYWSDWDGYYYYCADGCWYYYDAYYCDGYWFYYDDEEWDEAWNSYYVWEDCYDYGYYYYCPSEGCYYYEDGYAWCDYSYDPGYIDECSYDDYYGSYTCSDGCEYYDEFYYCDGYYYWYDWDYMMEEYDDLGWWDSECYEYEDYYYGGYYYCNDDCYYYTDYEYAWCGEDIDYYWDYYSNSYDCWYDENGYYVCADGCYYYDYYYYCDGYKYYYDDYWQDYWYDYSGYSNDYWGSSCEEYYDYDLGYYYYCWDDGCWYFDDYYYCDGEYYYYYDYTYDVWDGCSYGYDSVYGEYYYCPDDGCYYYDYWYECTESGYYDDWYYDNYGEYAPSVGYSDVEPWYPYVEAIDYLSENDVIEGYDDGTYKPTSDVNRVEALKIIFATLDNVLDIYELDASDLYISSNMNFSDVDDGSWYIPYLEEAFLLGIVQGYEDGTYKPGNTVNKVEILKIIIQAFDLEDLLEDNVTDALYPDVDTDQWYAPYVQLANEFGIFYDLKLSDNFNPGANMTRGEIADLVYRFADAVYLEDDTGGKIFK